MAQPSSEHWHPGAAYLYALHLDALSLAWEYLRRNPDYQYDWRRRRRNPGTAQRWGLRILEDPALDAREAQPTWLPGHDGEVRLHPDLDPPPDAEHFDFWRISGRRQLVHDGQRLLLAVRMPCRCIRLALAPAMADGMAYLYAIRACAAPCARYRALSAELDMLQAVLDGTAAATAATHPRPTRTSLLEPHTLQALDGTLAGASLRQIAEVLFGADTVSEAWHADGDLRARARRLVRRGRDLMRGGYRALAHIPPVEQGRFDGAAKRP